MEARAREVAHGFLWGMCGIAWTAMALVGCGAGDGGPSDGGPQGSSDFVSADPEHAGLSVAPRPEPMGGSSPGEVVMPSGDEFPRVPVLPIDPKTQLQGDMLYSLTWNGYLTVSDASEPDELVELGRSEDLGEGVRLEVRGEHAIAVTSEQTLRGLGLGFDVRVRVAVMDVGEPEAPSLIADVTVAGESPRVWVSGDVVYLFLHRTSEAPPGGSSVLASVRVSAGGQPELVSELEFPDGTGERWWRATAQRGANHFYVATPAPSGFPLTSTVEVVDASDPAGSLVRGARFEVAGAVASRAQMDERDGVLRVITPTPPPVGSIESASVNVLTYRVTSATEVPLLSEQVISMSDGGYVEAFFGGVHGYVLTSKPSPQGLASLQLIDLGDPAAPVAAGTVELFGERSVIAFETGGQRLLALGFNSNADGYALELALHEVSDPASPMRLDRVRLIDGDLSRSPQDSGFVFVEDAGLVLVPYMQDQPGCGSRFTLEVIGVGATALTKGATVTTEGPVFAAWPARDRLLLWHHDGIHSLDAADLAAARITGSLAQYLMAPVAVAGGRVVRWSKDTVWPKSAIDVVPPERLRAPTLAPLVLQANLGNPGDDCPGGGLPIGASEEHFYVEQGETSAEASEDAIEHFAVALELGNTDTPRVVGTLPVWNSREGVNDTQSGAIESGHPTVTAGTTLAFQIGCSSTCSNRPSVRLKVADFSDPTDPRLSELELPQGGGTALVASGDVLATSHYEPAGEGEVRFFLDRVDISDPAAPRLLEPVNVPGWLLAYEHGAQRLATLEPKRVIRDVSSADDCREALGPGAYFDETEPPAGACIRIDYTLHELSLHAEGAHLDRSFALPEGSLPQRAVAKDSLLALAFLPPEQLGLEWPPWSVLVRNLSAGEDPPEILEAGRFERRSLVIVDGLVVLDGSEGLVIDPRESPPVARPCAVPYPGRIAIALQIDPTACDSE